jgi:hypothetical protein
MILKNIINSYKIKLNKNLKILDKLIWIKVKLHLKNILHLLLLLFNLKLIRNSIVVFKNF